MIKIKSYEKVNPRDLNAPRKHYAQYVVTDKVDFAELTEIIAESSTLMPEDITGVLIALERNIIRALHNGRIVQLGSIGSLRLSIRAEGKDTPEEVSALDVRKAKVNYYAGKGISKMLKNLTFRKIDSAA